MDKEYLTFLLQNAPGFGAKSIVYIYNTLKKNNLTILDLFNLSISKLNLIFPEIGRGKFSRADFSILKKLDSDLLFEKYKKLKNQDVHIIGLDDERYPKRVLEKLGDDAPTILFCKGFLPLLNAENISIVGSRDADDFALMLTKRIANSLSKNGYNVTSGFAKGIDTNAHIGALEYNGTTTMVLSYGFNHLIIRKEIKEHSSNNNTLFISQFLPFEKFSGQNAMARNKLVCCLSKAVIVISSGPKRDKNGKMSGTFDAGLTALKYNIPLFVLNPTLLNPIPIGNDELIKLGGIQLSNGAELIEFLNNLNLEKLELINPLEILIEEPQPIYKSEEDILKNKLLQVLNEKPQTANEIIKLAKLELSTKKLISYLKRWNEIEKVSKGKISLYKIKKTELIQTSLFN